VGTKQLHRASPVCSAHIGSAGGPPVAAHQLVGASAAAELLLAFGILARWWSVGSAVTGQVKLV